MDYISILFPVLAPVIAKYPVLSSVLAVIGGVLAGLPVIINAIVTAWQAIVNLLKGLALIPGLSSLQKAADALSVSYEKVHSWDESILMPLLNRLSSLPLPKLPPKVAASGVEVKQ